MQSLNTFLHKLSKRKTKLRTEEKAAYHECGHIVMAYIFGYRCREVNLSKPENRKLALDYHSKTDLVEAIRQYAIKPELYYALDHTCKKSSAETAVELLTIMLAGSVSETVFLTEEEHQTSFPPYPIAAHDQKEVFSIDFFLAQTNTKHQMDFIQKTSKEVATLLSFPFIRRTVSQLQKELYAQKVLTQQRIEQLFQATGFWEFVLER
jgi:hypothetical protein